MNPGQIMGTEDLPGDFCAVFKRSHRTKYDDFISGEGMVK